MSAKLGNQRTSMIPLPALNWWKLGAYAALALILFGLGWHYGSLPGERLKAQIEAEATARVLQNERDAATRSLITQRNESEHAFTIASLRADLDWLRDSSSLTLSRATPSTDSVNPACRALVTKLIEASGERGEGFSRYRSEVLAISAGGIENTVRLETSASWWVEQGDIKP